MNKIAWTAMALSAAAIAVSIFTGVETVEPTKAYDFSTIQTNKTGCELRSPNGELLKFDSEEKRVLIPKGTLISGDCFIDEQ